jgi:hypothetical protein
MSQELFNRLKKVGKGALIAGGGVALTYLAGAIPGLNFGPYGAVVAGVAMVLINAARKGLEHLADTSTPKNGD